MRRVLSMVAWLFTNVGVALFCCSLVLVPNFRLLASDGSGPILLANCPGSSSCDDGCITDTCFQAGCGNVSGCTCSKATNCDGKCKCKTTAAGSACECGNKTTSVQ